MVQKRSQKAPMLGFWVKAHSTANIFWCNNPLTKPQSYFSSGNLVKAYCGYATAIGKLKNKIGTLVSQHMKMVRNRIKFSFKKK